MSAAQSIPEPRADDDDDVHLALTTAKTLLARGDREEALKWLRRAAEAASDANHDKRSLELFKAAGDFAAAMRAAGPSAPSPAAPAPARPGSVAPAPHPHAATVLSQGVTPSARSSPPPPPRGRGQQVSFPSVPNPPLAVAGPPSIEPMAPTVPQPPAPGREPAPASAARGPFVPSAQQGASALPKHARTLASAGPIDLKDPGAAQALRDAVNKANTLNDAGARQASRAAARQLQGTVITKDPPPPSNRPGPTQPTPAQPAGGVGAEASAARGQPAQPAATSARAPAGRAPAAAAPVQQPAPVSRGRRRTTLNGARRGATAANPTGGSQRADAAAARAQPRDDGPRQQQRGGFEDEITAIRDFSMMKAALASADRSGSDLDEHTNVLDGTEAGVEVVASEGRGPDSQVGESTDPGLHPQVLALMEPAPPTEAFPVSRAATDLGAICAYRVGFALDPSSGRLDVVTLAPGEPAPTGRLAALVVPTDVATSAALAELFARVRGDEGGGRGKR